MTVNYNGVQADWNWKRKIERKTEVKKLNARLGSHKPVLHKAKREKLRRIAQIKSGRLTASNGLVV